MCDPQKSFYELPKLHAQQSLDSIDLLRALVLAAEALAKLSATAEHAVVVGKCQELILFSPDRKLKTDPQRNTK